MDRFVRTSPTPTRRMRFFGQFFSTHPTPRTSRKLDVPFNLVEALLHEERLRTRGGTFRPVLGRVWPNIDRFGSCLELSQFRSVLRQAWLDMSEFRHIFVRPCWGICGSLRDLFLSRCCSFWGVCGSLLDFCVFGGAFVWPLCGPFWPYGGLAVFAHRPGAWSSQERGRRGPGVSLR